MLQHRHESLARADARRRPAAPGDLNALLSDLISPEEDTTPKVFSRWYRDLILAAEIGADRDWDLLRTRKAIKTERLQRDLKRGLAALLNDPAQPLSVAERVHAGFLLGTLGDPRFPSTPDEWRAELAAAQSGAPAGYLRRVEAGAYTIGSAPDEPDARDAEKPQHVVQFALPFWIARFPITNAQWHAWVAQANGQKSYFADDHDLNRPNQPVVGVGWAMCQAFCEWLSAQLWRHGAPAHRVRVEAAARGGDARRYPWGEAWHDDRAACRDDQELRGAGYTTPVCCYSRRRCSAARSTCLAISGSGPPAPGVRTPALKKNFCAAHACAARRKLRGRARADLLHCAKTATPTSIRFRVLLAEPLTCTSQPHGSAMPVHAAGPPALDWRPCLPLLATHHLAGVQESVAEFRKEPRHHPRPIS